MDHAFWHARWEANQIGFHQTDINPHLQTYWPDLLAPPEGRVLVPLCGKSRDMLWLAGAGQRVPGVEISPLAVEAFFAENGLPATRTQTPPFTEYHSGEVTLLQGDFFALNAEHVAGVTAVYDRASLIALPPDLRAQYAGHMAALLPTAVPVLLVTLDYPQAEMDGPPFAVSAREVDALYATHFEIAALGRQDILAENPRFQARGLTRLEEQVFRLVRR